MGEKSMWLLFEEGGLPLIDLSPPNNFCHSNDEDSAQDSARHTDLVSKIGDASKFSITVEVCDEYASALEKLSFELLELLALSLGLPEKRLNEPHLALGVGRHDAGALTVLAQDDVGGLDVKRKTDGEWVRVKPIRGSYIVNVGDIIQVWSNEKYESAEHRVMVNSKRERFYIPFFFNPSHHVMVKPLEELVDHQNPGKYKEYNWGKFFKTRKMSNFKNLDVQNIQIYHFKRSLV
ncbi:hypothetical protein MKX01_005770 [Papaver californicum]|nr:hypothetical protein MKX01_005770 [Papaver californicum]